jgi:hypothetical protein
MQKYIEIFEEEEETEGETGEAKVKIGEVEYTMDELSGLVADGQFKRDIEARQNTKIDRVLPEYTKLTQERSTWEQERDEYLRLKQERENANRTPDQYTPEQIEQARKEAKILGLFTKEDVEDYINTNFPKYYVQQREADKMLEKMEKFQSEIDGSDGRPKFNMDEVLEHIKVTGIKDPLKAYKDKYEVELDKWKEGKLLGSKREGLRTESGSAAGGKTPPEIRPNRDNLGKLMAEALRGS